jgi:hypothetical protein
VVAFNAIPKLQYAFVVITIDAVVALELFSNGTFRIVIILHNIYSYCMMVTSALDLDLVSILTITPAARLTITSHFLINHSSFKQRVLSTALFKLQQIKSKYTKSIAIDNVNCVT